MTKIIYKRNESLYFYNLETPVLHPPPKKKHTHTQEDKNTVVQLAYWHIMKREKYAKDLTSIFNCL